MKHRRKQFISIHHWAPALRCVKLLLISIFLSKLVIITEGRNDSAVRAHACTCVVCVCVCHRGGCQGQLWGRGVGIPLVWPLMLTQSLRMMRYPREASWVTASPPQGQWSMTDVTCNLWHRLGISRHDYRCSQTAGGLKSESITLSAYLTQVFLTK